MAGSARATFEPGRRLKGVIKSDIEMAVSAVNTIDGSPSSPDKCTSLLEIYELPFKLYIVGITESSLHYIVRTLEIIHELQGTVFLNSPAKLWLCHL